MKNFVFTHLKPSIWHYKLGKALKEKGIKITGIYLKNYDKTFYSSLFDEIISLELPNLKTKTIFFESIKNPLKFIKFFYKLLTIKPYVSISEAPPNYLSAFFIRLFKNRCPRIYFPYDIYSSRLLNPELQFSKKEISKEKYCFRKCDAIICKGGLGELQLLPADFNALKKPSFYLPIYATKDWFIDLNKIKKISSKDKELHIVNSGGFFPGSKMYDSMIPDFRHLLKQKIHFHFYVTKKLSKTEIYQFTLGDKKIKKYLHIHYFSPPKNLALEISKYDFATYFTHYSNLANPNAVKYTSGSKIATYLEAGVPILFKKENKVNADLVKKYGFGIVINDPKNIKKILKEVNYKKLVDNIKIFREKYSMENSVNKFIEFVDSLKTIS